jgi:hypothetical protein
MTGEIMAVTSTEDRGMFAMSTKGIIGSIEDTTDVGTENEGMIMVALRVSLYRHHRPESVSFFPPSLFNPKGYCSAFKLRGNAGG